MDWEGSSLLRAPTQATGQFEDKPTRGQSSRGLDNSRTSQLAGSESLKIKELLYFISTLNLTLNLTLKNIECWQRITSVICPN